ncbi:hypothetical protein ACIPC1_01505 [Streptomyces sp. NPDC087263]|uniref:hypothetical protein n=1 Tax=Streptomyces sp. NPDC087263 TaxID=3365773 RepID=UPI003822DFC9
MNSDTVTAISATAIALCSLWVSYTQTRATRQHNRQSVKPLLEMRTVKGYDDHKAGLQIINAGLGPAIVTNSVVQLDGETIGHWNLHAYHLATASMSARPKVYCVGPGAVILAGQTSFLLHVETFRDDEHDGFWELVTQRLVIEIHYESLYGGENFRAALSPF